MIRKEFVFEALHKFATAQFQDYWYYINKYLTKEEKLMMNNLSRKNRIYLHNKCMEKGIGYIDLYFLLK